MVQAGRSFIQASFAGLVWAGLMWGGAALAQTSATPPDAASPKPQLPPGDNLSDKLNQTDGVIQPPPTADNDIQKRAPVPNPGSTPVIPPPGTPGSPNQSVDPK